MSSSPAAIGGSRTGIRPARGPLASGRLARVLLPFVGLATVAASWQLVTSAGLVDPTIAPTFTDTVNRLGELLEQPAFWQQARDTIQAWAAGFVLAAVIAIPLGLLLGTSDRAYRFVRVPVESLRPVPPVVILPLALLLFGGDFIFKVVLIMQGVLWPILIQTVYGVRSTDPVAIDTTRSFRIDLVRRSALLRLPAAMPMVATGMRIGAATAFSVAIVTELVGGATGLGQILVLAQSGNDLTTVYAVTIFTGIVGVLITGVFLLIERAFKPWRPEVV